MSLSKEEKILAWVVLLGPIVVFVPGSVTVSCTYLL